MTPLIPIVLFAYARPVHLRRTLDCLRADRIPLLYIFSDGPRTPDKAPAVSEVRQILRAVDWCEVVLSEREGNLGLGRSLLTGVTEVLNKHEAAIIFEDDLICVPGTYDYLCAAMKRYWDEPRVMSVTGWTHRLVTPSDVADQPYLDGRTECLGWGTWARAWHGMKEDAKALMERCKAEGIDIYRYGAGLPPMAEAEQKKNVWAIRFTYWHILNRGLCVRPPWSLVEHVGWDDQGTHSKNAGVWAAPPLRPCAPIPAEWPPPVEHPDCPRLWCEAWNRIVAANTRSLGRRIAGRIRRLVLRILGASAS